MITCLKFLTPTSKENVLVLLVESQFIVHLNADIEARNDNSPKPRANLADGDEIIVAVIFQVNIVINVNKCVVESGANRHILQTEMPIPPTLLYEKNMFILEIQELLLCCLFSCVNMFQYKAMWDLDF